MNSSIESKAAPRHDAAQTAAARLAAQVRARSRALAGLITLVNAMGLLLLYLTGSAAHAQNGAYQRPKLEPALQAANPMAAVPAANYRSAVAGLPLGVENQSTDWRSANDTAGQFKRGHIDLLKLENASPQPSAPPSAPATSTTRSQP